jgi:hypothetical protein
MNKLLKNRNAVIIAAVVIGLLVLVVGFVLFLEKSSNQAQNSQTALPTQVPIPTLSPDSIGLTLVESADMHKATMKIVNTSDIASVDYQLSYNAQVSGQQVPRGTIGHVDVKTKGQVISQDMIFGTCSDVCHYDTGITDVKLIIKVTKTDGKVYQVVKSL